MFNDKDRNYIFDPLLIKRRINGEIKTFDVITQSYDAKSKWVLLIDDDTKEFYNGRYENNYIYVEEKMEEEQGYL